MPAVRQAAKASTAFERYAPPPTWRGDRPANPRLAVAEFLAERRREFHHDCAGESAFEFRPQHEHRGRVGQILRADPVDFPRGPLDGLIGEKVGNERVRVPVFRRPTGEADLHRAVGFPPRRAGRFEIDGGESAVADERHAAAISPVAADQASSAPGF